MNNKITNILRWIGVSMFALMAVVTLSMGGFLSAILLLLGGIIIAPLGFATKLRHKLKLNKVITIVLAVVLLFAGSLTMPTTDIVDDLESSVSDSNEIEDNNETDTPDSTDKTEQSEDTVQSDKEGTQGESQTDVGSAQSSVVTLSSIPEYSGKPYVALGNNVPNFTATELTTTGYEQYSELDSLGRTGVAIASLGKDTMPKEDEERGDISSIKPSGWVQGKYDSISGGWLYNRCHLIGWQLSAENANKKNLLTGTKYFNVEGMLPFENMVADYIKETANHVAYRVTPIYDGNNLLASGVQIEAYSVEDDGEGVQFNVFCYNVQPDIKIDYATGKNSGPSSNNTESSSTAVPPTNNSNKEETTSKPSTEQNNNNNQNTSSYKYVLNTSSKSKKFHYPDCHSAKKISDENYAESNENRDSIISQGYSPCGNCKP